MAAKRTMSRSVALLLCALALSTHYASSLNQEDVRTGNLCKQRAARRVQMAQPVHCTAAHRCTPPRAINSSTCYACRRIIIISFGCNLPITPVLPLKVLTFEFPATVHLQPATSFSTPKRPEPQSKSLLLPQRLQFRLWRPSAGTASCCRARCPLGRQVRNLNDACYVSYLSPTFLADICTFS